MHAADKYSYEGSLSELCYCRCSCSVVFSLTWCQQVPSDKLQAERESIGDAVRADDKASASRSRVPTPGEVQLAASNPPIHVTLCARINQVGVGDSLPLRKGICKYLGECTVKNLGRIYADGPFAVDSSPPTLALMGKRIWKSKDEWSASAPFIDRYEMKGNGHTPILLDEFNGWPLAYPLKCKWLIAPDALLTGASKLQLSVCAMATTPDSAHSKRYLSYRWIENSEAFDLGRVKRQAKILNHSLKNGLMDWGFADAVIALGPMKDVLSAGIRELLIKSFQSPVKDASTPPAKVDGEVCSVTHSLGSYLSLIALDSDLLGSDNPDLSGFQITPNRSRQPIISPPIPQNSIFWRIRLHFSNWCGYRTRPNIMQVLAHQPVEKSLSVDRLHIGSACATLISQGGLPLLPYLRLLPGATRTNLLSWEVPQIAGVHVVNITVLNSGFKLPPIVESPTAAHANYAKNREGLRMILKPSHQR